MLSSSRIARLTVLKQLGPRLFSTSAVARPAVIEHGAVILAGSRGMSPVSSPAVWVRVFPVRFASTAATPAVPAGEDQEGETKKEAGAVSGGGERKEISSYWGIRPSKIAKEDGTEWRWHCFRVNNLNILFFPPLFSIFANF